MSRTMRHVGSARRRVLVLAYDFPPCRAPGAAVRSAKFVRYLPEFGWQPTVLCRDDRPPDVARRGENVVAVPTELPEALSYQAAAWRWAVRILPAARRLVDAGDVDLVYASGPPFWHVLAAARLSSERGVPLVVDLRDAWSLDPFEDGGLGKRMAKRALCRWVYPRFERRVFGAAAAVVFNTPSMASAYAARMGAGEYVTLPNGFDAADFVGPSGWSGRAGGVTFLHCGRFGGIAGRSVEPVVRALRLALERGRSVRLRLLGDASAAVKRQVRRLRVEDAVELAAPRPHADAVRAIRGADVLLLYQAAGRGPVTPVAGKTFEYLRSGRPVLAAVPPGDNQTLVRAHAACHRTVPPGDRVALADAMCALADAHPTATREPGAGFAQYERRALTARLAALFDRACARSGAGPAAAVSS